MNDILPLVDIHNASLNDHIYQLDLLDSLVFKLDKNTDNDRHNTTNQSELLISEPVCNYYFCSDINSDESFSANHLKLMSFNISSIPLHFDILSTQILDSLNFNFDIITICETRLNNQLSSLYLLDNYTEFFQNKSTAGGGLVIFLRSYFQSIKLDELSFQLPHVESLFIRITQPYQFIIGTIYRPPNSSMPDFLISMETILQTLSCHAKLPCYVTGDFNINLLKHNSDNTVMELVNLFYSYFMFPVITKPTRVTQTSASLIDHIWTNNIHCHVTSGILHSTISDHFPVFASFTTNRTLTSNTHKTISTTKITDEYINNFKLELSSYQWKQDIKFNVEVDYDNYISKFSQLYMKHFPTIDIQIKDKFTTKPYITPAIRNSIKQRHKLQKLFAKWPLTYGEEFKRYRNTLTNVIRTAKQNYYKTKLTENSSNSSKTWDIINTLMGRKKPQLPTYFEHNNKHLTNNSEIAESFNNYFSTIANQIAQSINDTQVSFTHFLPAPVPFSFYLRPVTSLEIENIINNLKSTSAGHDNIHIKVVKKCSYIISSFLEYIINLSFQKGCVPKQIQIAKIIPIHKKGTKTLLANYRPISLLSSFSKIFEKAMAARLMDYLTQHSLLSACQHGFRPGYSTERALHSLSQSIYHSIDNKLYQITLFCDFTKAFDTISHSILFEKLITYGIRGPAYHWIKSYLSHRKQFTIINNVSSSLQSINCGIPQGSVLGPLLFLIYINDISRSSIKLNYVLFADDTTIYLQGRDLQTLQDTFNQELVHLSNWISSNKLSLNHSKTNYMVSHTLLSHPNVINIKIENKTINQVEETKFLGVTIDNTLTWKTHINDTKIKISKLTGMFYRIREYLNQDNIKLIYSSLAYPHFLYCAAIWGGAYQTHIQSLFVTQKKLIRVMFNCHRYYHTNPIFSHHKILKVPDIIQLQTLLFVFNALVCNNSTDRDFQIIAHNIATRRPCTLRIPLCRTSHAQQSVLVRGARQWNQLPDDLKLAPAKHIFKSKLKLALLHNE